MLDYNEQQTSLLEYNEQLTGLLNSMSECVDTCQEKATSVNIDDEFKNIINVLIDSFVSINTIIEDKKETNENNGMVEVSENFAKNFEVIVSSVNSGSDNIEDVLPSDFYANFISWKNAVLSLELPEKKVIKKHKINLKNLRGQ